MTNIIVNNNLNSPNLAIPPSPISDFATAWARSDVRSAAYTSQSACNNLVSQGIITQNVADKIWQLGYNHIPLDVMEIIMNAPSSMTIKQLVNNTAIMAYFNSTNSSGNADLINGLRIMNCITSDQEVFLNFYLNQTATDRQFFIDVFSMADNATIGDIRQLNYGIYNLSQNYDDYTMNITLKTPINLLWNISTMGFLNRYIYEFYVAFPAVDSHESESLFQDNILSASQTLANDLFETNYMDSVEWFFAGAPVQNRTLKWWFEQLLAKTNGLGEVGVQYGLNNFVYESKTVSKANADKLLNLALLVNRANNTSLTNALKTINDANKFDDFIGYYGGNNQFLNLTDFSQMFQYVVDTTAMNAYLTANNLSQTPQITANFTHCNFVLPDNTKINLNGFDDEQIRTIISVFVDDERFDAVMAYYYLSATEKTAIATNTDAYNFIKQNINQSPQLLQSFTEILQNCGKISNELRQSVNNNQATLVVYPNFMNLISNQDEHNFGQFMQKINEIAGNLTSNQMAKLCEVFSNAITNSPLNSTQALAILSNIANNIANFADILDVYPSDNNYTIDELIASASGTAGFVLSQKIFGGTLGNSQINDFLNILSQLGVIDNQTLTKINFLSNTINNLSLTGQAKSDFLNRILTQTGYTRNILANIMQNLPANNQFSDADILYAGVGGNTPASQLFNLLNGATLSVSQKAQLINDCKSLNFLSAATANNFLALFVNLDPLISGIIFAMPSSTNLTFLQSLNLSANGANSPIWQSLDANGKTALINGLKSVGYITQDIAQRLSLYFNLSADMQNFIKNHSFIPYSVQTAIDDDFIHDILTGNDSAIKTQIISVLQQFGLISGTNLSLLSAFGNLNSPTQNFIHQHIDDVSLNAFDVIHDASINSIWGTNQATGFINSLQLFQMINSTQATQCEGFTNYSAAVRQCLQSLTNSPFISSTQAIQNSNINQILQANNASDKSQLLDGLSQFGYITSEMRAQITAYSLATGNIANIILSIPANSNLSFATALQNPAIVGFINQSSTSECNDLFNALNDAGFINGATRNQLTAYASASPNARLIIAGCNWGSDNILSYSEAIGNLDLRANLTNGTPSDYESLLTALENSGLISASCKLQLQSYRHAPSALRLIYNNPPLTQFSVSQALGNSNILSVINNGTTTQKHQALTNLADFGLISAQTTQKLQAIADAPAQVRTILTKTTPIGGWTLNNIINDSDANDIFTGTDNNDKNALITALGDMGFVNASQIQKLQSYAQSSVAVQNILKIGGNLSFFAAVQNPTIRAILTTGSLTDKQDLIETLNQFGIINDACALSLMNYANASDEIRAILNNPPSGGSYGSPYQAITDSNGLDAALASLPANQISQLITGLEDFGIINAQIATQLQKYANLPANLKEIMKISPLGGQYSLQSAINNTSIFAVLQGTDGDAKTNLLDALASFYYITPSTLEKLNIYAFASQNIRDVLTQNPAGGGYDFYSALANTDILNILNGADSTEKTNLLSNLRSFNYLSPSEADKLSAYIGAPNEVRAILRNPPQIGYYTTTTALQNSDNNGLANILNGTNLNLKNSLLTALQQVGQISAETYAQLISIANADPIVKTALGNLTIGQTYTAAQLVQMPNIAAIYQNSSPNIISQLTNSLLGFNLISAQTALRLNQYALSDANIQAILSSSVIGGVYSNINQALDNTAIYNILHATNNAANQGKIITALYDFGLISQIGRDQAIFYAAASLAVKDILFPAPPSGYYNYAGILANPAASDIFENGSLSLKTSLINGLKSFNYITSLVASELSVYASAPQIIKNILKQTPSGGSYDLRSAIANYDINAICDSTDDAQIAQLCDALLQYNFITPSVRDGLINYASLPNNIKSLIKDGNILNFADALNNQAINQLITSQSPEVKAKSLTGLKDFSIINASVYTKIQAYDSASVGNKVILRSIPTNSNFTTQNIFANNAINAVLNGNDANEQTDLIQALRGFGYIDASTASQLNNLCSYSSDIKNILINLPSFGNNFTNLCKNTEIRAIFTQSDIDARENLLGGLNNYGILTNQNTESALSYFIHAQSNLQNIMLDLVDGCVGTKTQYNFNEILAKPSIKSLFNQSAMQAQNLINAIYQAGLINDASHNSLLAYNQASSVVKSQFDSLSPSLPSSANDLLQNADFRVFCANDTEQDKILFNLLKITANISENDKNNLMQYITIPHQVGEVLASKCATNPVQKYTQSEFLSDAILTTALSGGDLNMRKQIINCFVQFGVVDANLSPILLAFTQTSNPIIRQFMQFPPAGGSFVNIAALLNQANIAQIMLGTDLDAKNALINELRDSGLINSTLANQLGVFVALPSSILNLINQNAIILSGDAQNIIKNSNVQAFLTDHPALIPQLLTGLQNSGIITSTTKNKLTFFANLSPAGRGAMQEILGLAGFKDLTGNQLLTKTSPSSAMDTIKQIYNSGTNNDKTALNNALESLGIVSKNGIADLQYYGQNGAALVLSKIDESQTDKELEQFTSARFIEEVQKSSVAIAFDEDKKLFKWGNSFVTFQTFITLMTGRLANSSTAKVDKLITDMKNLSNQKKLMNKLNTAILGFKNYVATASGENWLGGINGYQIKAEKNLPVLCSAWQSGMLGGSYDNSPTSDYTKAGQLEFNYQAIANLFNDITDKDGNAIAMPTSFIANRYSGLNVYLYFFNYAAVKTGLATTLGIDTNADYTLSTNSAWWDVNSAMATIGGKWQQKLGGFSKTEWNSLISKDQIDLMQTGFKNLSADVETAISLKQIEIDRYVENRSNLVQALQDRIEKINQTNRNIIR